MVRSGLVAVLAVGVACCGSGEGSPQAGSVVRDSLGVRIVENAVPSSDNWMVGESPRFVLGWDEQDPTFTWLQSGRILPEGGAIVGDFGSGTLYRVDATGVVRDTWGRNGEGPGEYQGFDAILVHGDSILVSDGRLRRLTLLTAEGEVAGTETLHGSFLHRVASALDDSRLLLVPGEGYGGRSEIRPEWIFEEQPILAATRPEGAVDTLVTLPHLRRWYGERGAGPGPVHVKGRAGGFPGGFAWARSDRAGVHWYDTSGQLVQIARWAAQPEQMSADWSDRFIAAFEVAMRRSGAPEEMIEPRLADMRAGLERFDDPVPYWDNLVVDHAGNVWLRDFSLPGAYEASWTVLRHDGTLLGTVQIPNAVQVLDISERRVLAVYLDDFDVPALVMLDLLKE